MARGGRHHPGHRCRQGRRRSSGTGRGCRCFPSPPGVQRADLALTDSVEADLSARVVEGARHSPCGRSRRGPRPQLAADLRDRTSRLKHAIPFSGQVVPHQDAGKAGVEPRCLEEEGGWASCCPGRTQRGSTVAPGSGTRYRRIEELAPDQQTGTAGPLRRCCGPYIAQCRRPPARGSRPSSPLMAADETVR